MAKMVTLILSDTHFGDPMRHVWPADRLQPLWRQARAQRLIINGDVGEIHHPFFRPAAIHAIQRLTHLCERDGVKLDLLSGNHDPYISTTRKHILNQRVLVTHGDAFHPALTPWSPAVHRLVHAHRSALAQLKPHQHHDLDARLAAAEHACHSEWLDPDSPTHRKTTLSRLLRRPWLFLRLFSYWTASHRFAARFARELAPPTVRFVICGHTHCAGVWSVGRITVVNTGAYHRFGRPHAVVVDDQTLRVHRIQQAPTNHHLQSDNEPQQHNPPAHLTDPAPESDPPPAGDALPAHAHAHPTDDAHAHTPILQLEPTPRRVFPLHPVPIVDWTHPSAPDAPVPPHQPHRAHKPAAPRADY